MSFLIITFFLCPFFNLDLPLQHGINDEVLLPERQCCHQLRKRIMEEGEPRPPKIKEEPEELCTSQEGEQLALKQETDSFMMTPGYEECDHSEPEPNPDPFLSQHSPVNESQDLDESRFKGTRSSANEELTPKEEHYSNMSDTDSVEDSPMSESRCNTNTGKESVMCDVCGKAFQFRSKLKIHYRTHTGEKPFVCTVCGRRFSQISSLNVHIKIHTGNNLYSCECGKSFRYRAVLIRHKKTHRGEKPHSCKTCGKSFRRSDTLLCHMRTHTGEKSYFCERCGKSFGRSDTLLDHMRIHTGEKPYLCKTCGKSFGNRGSLKTHVHTDEKPPSCETW